MARTGQVVRRGDVRAPVTFLVASWMLMSGCQSQRRESKPSIEFTKLPPAGEGTSFKIEAIEGRVSGAKPGQRIVLFAKAGIWWVQPFIAQPYTEIVDAKWKGTTHPGGAYAALLVASDYKPPPTTSKLPGINEKVLAVAIAEAALVHPPVQTLRFSGYEWEIREGANDPGGSLNFYDPANASLDEKGRLHLRILKRSNRWTSAEVMLPQSLGYGSYRFVVHDVSQLEPAAVLNLSMRDNSGQLREMDIENSRWGEPKSSKNAQYVIQPFYLPVNVVRFLAPPGVLTYSLLWEPGRTSFETARRRPSGQGSSIVSQHVFTSGVPSPGKESIHMNLYVFDNKDNPLRHPSEVIVEKFEYFP